MQKIFTLVTNSAFMVKQAHRKSTVEKKTILHIHQYVKNTYLSNRLCLHCNSIIIWEKNL